MGAPVLSPALGGRETAGERHGSRPLPAVQHRVHHPLPADGCGGDGDGPDRRVHQPLVSVRGGRRGGRLRVLDGRHVRSRHRDAGGRPQGRTGGHGAGGPHLPAGRPAHHPAAAHHGQDGAMGRRRAAFPAQQRRPAAAAEASAARRAAARVAGAALRGHAAAQRPGLGDPRALRRAAVPHGGDAGRARAVRERAVAAAAHAARGGRLRLRQGRPQDLPQAQTAYPAQPQTGAELRRRDGRATPAERRGGGGRLRRRRAGAVSARRRPAARAGAADARGRAFRGVCGRGGARRSSSPAEAASAVRPEDDPHVITAGMGGRGCDRRRFLYIPGVFSRAKVVATTVVTARALCRPPRRAWEMAARYLTAYLTVRGSVWCGRSVVGGLRQARAGVPCLWRPGRPLFYACEDWRPVWSPVGIWGGSGVVWTTYVTFTDKLNVSERTLTELDTSDLALTELHESDLT